MVSGVQSRFVAGHIVISRDYDREIPPVAIDAGKIRQVCLNLLMNAAQAMTGGGTITLSTRNDGVHRGMFVCFADTGSGVSADIQDRIFDPFFTTKEPGQGTGLGLTVSYGIVEEHKGHIAFETECGKGSVFKVWLPWE